MSFWLLLYSGDTPLQWVSRLFLSAIHCPLLSRSRDCNFLLSVFGQLSLIKMDRARESLLCQGSTPCKIDSNSLAGREPAASVLLFPVCSSLKSDFPHSQCQPAAGTVDSVPGKPRGSHSCRESPEHPPLRVFLRGFLCLCMWNTISWSLEVCLEPLLPLEEWEIFKFEWSLVAG